MIILNKGRPPVKIVDADREISKIMKNPLNKWFNRWYELKQGFPVDLYSHFNSMYAFNGNHIFEYKAGHPNTEEPTGSEEQYQHESTVSFKMNNKIANKFRSSPVYAAHEASGQPPTHFK